MNKTCTEFKWWGNDKKDERVKRKKDVWKGEKDVKIERKRKEKEKKCLLSGINE